MGGERQSGCPTVSLAVCKGETRLNQEPGWETPGLYLPGNRVNVFTKAKLCGEKHLEGLLVMSNLKAAVQISDCGGRGEKDRGGSVA